MKVTTNLVCGVEHPHQRRHYQHHLGRRYVRVHAKPRLPLANQHLPHLADRPHHRLRYDHLQLSCCFCLTPFQMPVQQRPWPGLVALPETGHPRSSEGLSLVVDLRMICAST